jgi:hypothetical protein
VEEPRAREAAGSLLPEVYPADGDTMSQHPEATSGPVDQMVTGSWTSEVPLDPEDQELLVPEPMEIDTSDPPPPGGSKPSNDRCTTSVRSSMRPR